VNAFVLALSAFGTRLNKRILMMAYLIDSAILGLLTLGNCRVAETISSVAWDMERDGKFLGCISRPVIDLLMRPFEADHCQKAYQTYLKIIGVL